MTKNLTLIEQYLQLDHLTEIIAKYDYDLEEGDGLVQLISRGAYVRTNSITVRTMIDVLPVRIATAPAVNAGCPCQNLAYSLREECDVHA